MNKVLSHRQILRLYVFDLMGLGTLLLPPYLAKLCGAQGIYAILFGIALGLVYLIYLGVLIGRAKTNIYGFLEQNAPSWLRGLVLIWIIFHCIVTAGFCTSVFADLMQYSLVEDTSYGVIVLLILLGATYAISGGIERRARVYEVLFWLILVPYLVMMLSSVRNVKWHYIEPVLNWDSNHMVEGIYLVFLLMTPVFFSLFLGREDRRKNHISMVRHIGAAVLLAGGILLGSYVLLLGNFGIQSLSNLPFPVITLMSTIQFEGNFLKRMDAPMLAVWFFTLFALLNLHLHYGVEMFARIIKAKQTDKKLSFWQIFLPVIGVYLVAYSFYLEEGLMRRFLTYYAYVAVPLMIILPLLLLGCGNAELEERCFPMLVSVGFEEGRVSYGAGFPKADATGQSNTGETQLKALQVFDIDYRKSKEKFESRLNKLADYNHLKVLVMEDDLLEKPIAYSVMLQDIAQSESFPRNTYVCVVEDIEELYELEKNLSQDIGTYMEEYLKLHEKNKGRLLTLGDLIDEYQNQTMVVYLPYMDIEDNFIEWKGYVNTSGEIWQESE